LWSSLNNLAIKTHKKTTKKKQCNNKKTNKSSREKKEGEEKGWGGKEKKTREEGRGFTSLIGATSLFYPLFHVKSSSNLKLHGDGNIKKKGGPNER